VYHYHLHVVYIPVVQKDILWSKRCKDPALRGTVKERIIQISHSKKWRSTRVLDERGKPLYDFDGKPIMENSYSVLQDIFFEHMEEAGYHGFQRGERGSSADHLSVLQYKTEKEQERLSGLKEKTAAAAETLEALAQEQEQGWEAVEALSQKAADYELRLEELAPQIRDVEELVSDVRSTEELVPEPGALETVKHYRQNKVYPLVEKLRQWLLALYRKYLDLKQDYRELRQKFSRVSQERSYYEEQANTLSAENYLLRESAQDLSRVRRALGDETVDDAIEWAKDREMTEKLAAPTKREAANRPAQNRSDWETR
jgi:predicted nuclease with TOPRIM domain